MPFDRAARWAFVVACLGLLASGFGFHLAVRQMSIFLQKKPVALRSQLVNISTTLGDWRAAGPDEVLDEAVVETLGTNAYLSRVYSRTDAPGTPPVHVHVAYYTGLLDAVPHIPDRCFVAAGLHPQRRPTNYPLDLDRSSWRFDEEDASGVSYPALTYRHPWTGRVEEVHLPAGEFLIRTIEFQAEKHPDRRIYGGYFFITNGRVTPTPEGVKLMAFTRHEEYAYYAKVQLTMNAPLEIEPEQYVATVSDLLNDLLPEIMRCLPDWPEQVRRTREHAGTSPVRRGVPAERPSLPPGQARLRPSHE